MDKEGKLALLCESASHRLLACKNWSSACGKLRSALFAETMLQRYSFLGVILGGCTWVRDEGINGSYVGSEKTLLHQLRRRRLFEKKPSLYQVVKLFHHRKEMVCVCVCVCVCVWMCVCVCV